MAKLVSIDECKGLMPKAMVDDIQKDGRYDAIEGEAAKILRDLSGIELPANPDVRLAEHDWVIVPMVGLMRYLYSPHLAIPNQASADKIIHEYDNSLKIINDHRVSTESMTGAIKDLYE